MLLPGETCFDEIASSLQESAEAIVVQHIRCSKGRTSNSLFSGRINQMASKTAHPITGATCRRKGRKPALKRERPVTDCISE
jgi:hypothetical protein